MNKYINYKSVHLRILFILAAVIAGAFLITSPHVIKANQPWYNSDWSHRKKITIDHTKVSGSLSDFPILIDTTDTDWKSASNGGDVAQEDGGDILFTATDGVTNISYQLESYDPATGHLMAWVKVPSLSSSIPDTDIYIYYGNDSGISNQENPTGVWNSGYVGIWHLNEDPSGSSVLDSTSTHNDGADTGATFGATSGFDGGGAFNFDGVDDFIEIPHNANQLLTGGFTMSAWIKPDTVGETAAEIINKSNGLNGTNGFRFNLASTLNRLNFQVNTGTTVQSADNSIMAGDNNWYYVTVTSLPDRTISFYINGVHSGTSAKTGSLAGITTTNPLRIGQRSGNTDRTFDGLIDEVRISNQPLSADWVATEYTNQSSPADFYTVGPERQEDSPPDPHITLTESSGDTRVTEGGATDSYQIVLDSAPTSDVTISLESDNADTGATASPATLTFTSENWDAPQIVTVTATEDHVVDNDSSTISHTVDSLDVDYDGMFVPDVDVDITDAPSELRIWAFGDPHIDDDLETSPPYLSLESAIKDTTLGGDEGGEAFNWDIALGLGDFAGDQTCPTESGGQNLQDQFTGAGVDRNLFYNIIGNHDASADDASWFRKWVDPMGENTQFSGIDNSLRPYPITGEWDHYSFQVGNILFLMLGDHNFGGLPFGRACDGGYPAGRVTKETYDWWVEQVEANPDKIIVTGSHEGLLDTIIYTGLGEGYAQGIHGGETWADQAGSSIIYAIDNITVDGYDENQQFVGVPDYGFKSYLDQHPGAVDFWLSGHTHNHLFPGKTFNGRSDIETVDGVNFINVGALAKEHAGPVAPFSRVFDFYNGADTVTVRTYMHSSAWNSVPEGFYDGATKVFTLDKDFKSDDTPPVITEVRANPGESDAEINWNTNEESSSLVDYGPKGDYGQSTAETDTSPRVISHSVNLNNLKSCSTYHYKVHSTDSASNESESADQTFITSGCTISGSGGTIASAPVSLSPNNPISPIINEVVNEINNSPQKNKQNKPALKASNPTETIKPMPIAPVNSLEKTSTPEKPAEIKNTAPPKTSVPLYKRVLIFLANIPNAILNRIRQIFSFFF